MWRLERLNVELVQQCHKNGPAYYYYEIKLDQSLSENFHLFSKENLAGTYIYIIPENDDVGEDYEIGRSFGRGVQKSEL